MYELFVFDTFWFWFLVGAEVILLFLFVNYENGVGATISLLIFGACLQWLGDINIFACVRTHPWVICGAVGAYFLLGVTWGIVRWYFFCLERIREYQHLKERFLDKQGLPRDTKVIPENLQEAWYLALESPFGRISDSPKVRDNKNRILGWMTFWVVSVIWFCINDFVKHIFLEIYQWMVGFLQRIADNMFAHVAEDLKATRTDRFKDRR